MRLFAVDIHPEPLGELADALGEEHKIEVATLEDVRRLRTHPGAIVMSQRAALFGVLNELTERFPAAGRVVFGSPIQAVDADWMLRAGATHCLELPWPVNRLRHILTLDALAEGFSLDNKRPILESVVWRKLVDQVKKAARLDVSVFLYGESGTGKEVITDMIHQMSPRAAMPCIKVNCAALPRELIESELFGSVKGSFTGSTGNRVGLFRAAHGGTLLLDELTEMPIEVQAKLLRVIQEKEVRPVGSDKSERVDVRLIAATNRHPKAAILGQKLREDLYYRLARWPIQVPALRDRRDDVPALVRHFVKIQSVNFGMRPPRVSAAAMDFLKAYDWPGNIRQLESTIGFALVNAGPGCEELTTEHIELDHFAGFRPEEVLDARREQVIDALTRSRWNVSAAARLLGRHHSTIQEFMRENGIKRPE